MRIFNLSNKSGSLTSSDKFVLDNGTNVMKIDYNALAKAIIEQYTGSTLAGSAQSVKAALDTLNSKSISNPQLLTASDDMNTLTASGIYYTINTDAPANGPTSDAYNSVIIVLKARSIDVLQFYLCNNKGTIYYRTQFGGTWRAWQKLQLVAV